ncbi:MAG: hypothetical protein HY289_11285 [Planctomycetes bacterium]|nr:hypothetical protein [Planctomycetota bacterium]
MSPSSTARARPFPLGLQVACSVLAVGHLLLIGLFALAQDSGPWWYDVGPNDVMPPSGVNHSPGPVFARAITVNFTEPYYVVPLRMTHNYHFQSNRRPDYSVYFEVFLKNERGDVLRTLKFPDDKASFWVRHRQEILAQNLSPPDQQMPPRGNEKVAAGGKDLPKVEIWVREDAHTKRLKPVEETDDLLRESHEVASPWAKTLVKSYLRYLCREHGAASAELVRYSRRTVLPLDLYAPRPEDTFKELKSYFGEMKP